MPYVITTINECTCCAERLPGLPGAGGAAHLCAECGGSDGRRAVATLEEARSRAALEVGFHGTDELQFLQAADSLPESGGTIGPLPDGTVIEVARVSEATLYNAIHASLCCPACGIQKTHVSGSHLIDAYNAREGS